MNVNATMKMIMLKVMEIIISNCGIAVADAAVDTTTNTTTTVTTAVTTSTAAWILAMTPFFH